MSPEKCARLEAESQNMINFAMLCARIQKAGGRAFYFEHPRGAETWADDEVVALQEHVVNFDHCRLGLVSPKGQPMKKATSLLTNSRFVCDAFEGLYCACGEEHCQIQGSQLGCKLSRWAARYPPLMCHKLANAAIQWADATP